MEDSNEPQASSAIPPQCRPGPWHYDPEFGEVLGADGRIVAESVTTSCGPLIAATPDLLAALKETAAALDWRDPEEAAGILRDAYTAIAKAEGREQ